MCLLRGKYLCFQSKITWYDILQILVSNIPQCMCDIHNHLLNIDVIFYYYIYAYV